MTVGAGNIRVLAVEREYENIMIEVASVGIHAVMTRQAIAAPTCYVRVGESRINLTMTSIARLQIELGNIVGMAIGTSEGFSRRGELVTLQRVAERFMRKSDFVHHGQRRVGAAMFGMTIAARDGGGIFHHPSVKRRQILQLSRKIAMAIQTTVCHGGAFPRRSVTGLAIPAGLRVRRDAAQHLPALRVQLAGAVQQTAASVDVSNNEERGDERGDDAAS